MKKIYVCIGVNGSGKTTYVQKQLNSETASSKILRKTSSLELSLVN